MTKTDSDKVADVPEPAQGPVGFERADTDVDNYPAHDFDTDRVLTGAVVKVKTVELMRRAQLVDVRMAVILKDEGELVLLWESANLSNFFDCLVDEMLIHVELRGTQQLSGGRTMKLFDAFYK